MSKVNTNGTVKHPCRNCVYFHTCGDSARIMPCNGRRTKTQIRKEREEV